MLKGIDISHWNKGVDLSTPKIDFVICKATQGIRYRDPMLDDYMRFILENGLLFGFYHFLDSRYEPVKQAEWFVKNIAEYVGFGILVLDFEQEGAFKWGSVGALEFLNRVYELTGVRPLIYMNKSDLKKYSWHEVVAQNYGLWLASLTTPQFTDITQEVPKDNVSIYPWKVRAIRQYSFKGLLNRVYGKGKVTCDLNIAFMDVDAWSKYARRNYGENIF